MSWRGVYGRESPRPSTEVATVKRTLRTASAMTAQDSRPPAREKTSICRLANSSVEAMTFDEHEEEARFRAQALECHEDYDVAQAQLHAGHGDGQGD